MSLIHRKIYRLFSFSFIILYFYTSRKLTLGVLSIFLIPLFFLEYLRFKRPEINEKIFEMFSSFLKNEEKKFLSSTTIFFLVMFLTILFFPKDIAIISLAFLIFSDASSGLVGFYWGRVRLIRNKTLEGTFTFFLTCLFIGLVCKMAKFKISWLAIFSSSFLASVVELIPYVDDNISIPLVSAFTLKMLS